MNIGYSNIAGYSDFGQPANNFLTVRFVVNVTLLLDGVSDTINFYMWSDSGTPNAKGGIYKFNPVSGNLDKIVVSSSISINTTPGWRSVIPSSVTLLPGNVYHFGMVCDANYNMKFLSPAESGDVIETQSMETGFNFGTPPATILNSELTKYAVSSGIYITGTAQTSGKTIQGVSTIQGISTIQL